MIPGKAALRRYILQYMVSSRLRYKTRKINNAVPPGAQEGGPARRLEEKDRRDGGDDTLPAGKETPIDMFSVYWALACIGDSNGNNEDGNHSSDCSSDSEEEVGGQELSPSFSSGGGSRQITSSRFTSLGAAESSVGQRNNKPTPTRLLTTVSVMLDSHHCAEHRYSSQAQVSTG